MANISVEEIKKLNTQIEASNRRSTQVEAQIGVFRRQLEESIRKYEDTYGVSLSGRSLKEIASKVTTEHTALVQRISTEFETKTAVMEALGKNDVEEACRLLNIANGSEETEELKSSEGPETYTTEDDEIDVTADDKADGASFGEEDLEEENTETDGFVDDDPLNGDILDEDEVPGDSEVTEDSSDFPDDNDFNLDDDDLNLGGDDVEYGSTGAANFLKAVSAKTEAKPANKTGLAEGKPPVAKSSAKPVASAKTGSSSSRVSKSVTGSSVADTVKTLGKGSGVQDEYSLEDDDDDDFGMKDILASSSKFKFTRG